MGTTASLAEVDIDLARQMVRYADDPLGYVLDVFPWGEPGTDLENAAGPDEWQTKALGEIGDEVKARNFDGHTPVAPIRFVRASGHDIGKTTLAAWIVNWIKDTRPDSVGTVTANTFTQLETKTWAAIQKWAKLALTRDWWVITGAKIHHRDPDKKELWFVACQSSSEENSEAFAGQHAKFSTSYYVFDESSAIADEIWKVAEGGLTDGEPMIFAFGNPTRNTGMFYEACFGSKRHRWNHGSIDSRSSGISNKKTIAEWIEDYGEDSDFVRVRVRGLPPRASELQFIDAARVADAQQRTAVALETDPLIAGFDASGGGSAWNVVRFRRGVDARSIPPVRVPGEHGKDREVMIGKLADILTHGIFGQRVSMLFVDSAFGSPIVERLHVLGFENVIEVNFGAKSPNQHQANHRAFMWNQMKEWLQRGAIDRNDVRLEMDLIGPGFQINKQNQLVLEPKQEMQKRGLHSPDDADALALTFAHPVAPVNVAERRESPRASYGADTWMR